MRTALTIAGSDSGGGAGIQADLKTFAAHGVFGTSAITAVTAQNTLGVTAWQAMPADLVTAQIEAVAADFDLRAVKVGMLATAAIVEAVAATIVELDLPDVVVDPVMVATGGDRLLEEDAIEAIKRELMPHTRVLTPNVPEAEALSGMGIASVDDMRSAARRILASGPRVCTREGGPSPRIGVGGRGRHRTRLVRAAPTAGREDEHTRHRVHAVVRHRGKPRTWARAPTGARAGS